MKVLRMIWSVLCRLGVLYLWFLLTVSASLFIYFAAFPELYDAVDYESALAAYIAAFLISLIALAIRYYFKRRRAPNVRRTA
jgi:hypothetical protein